jgi:hypothetical protein
MNVCGIGLMWTLLIDNHGREIVLERSRDHDGVASETTLANADRHCVLLGQGPAPDDITFRFNPACVSPVALASALYVLCDRSPSRIRIQAEPHRLCCHRAERPAAAIARICALVDERKLRPPAAPSSSRFHTNESHTSSRA